MAQGTSSATAQAEELQHAVTRLRAENKALKAQLSARPRRRGQNVWRNIAVTLCIILAVITLIAGNILFWAGSTLTNTDKYVATIQPLGQDKAIQAAVADYTTAKLFDQTDVTAAVTDALPPKADFLAPQLTSGLKNATKSTLQKIFASEKFQNLWVNTNRAAHERLILAIKNTNGDGVINLQEVYMRLSQNLKDTKLGFLADKQLPPKVGSITVVDAKWVPKARAFINASAWLKPVSLLLVAVFSALAIWLVRNRRRLVITLSAVFGLSMAALLAAIGIVQDRVAAHVQPAYRTAADHAANIVLQPLAHQTTAILAFSLLVLIIAWLTGPYKRAKAARNGTTRYLAAPLHGLVFRRENAFTLWLAGNRQLIDWAVVAVVGFIMLLVRLSPKLVALYGLLMLVLVLLNETLAAPHSRR